MDVQTRAMLDFAYKLSRQPARVTREDWDALRAAGFTERQAVEVVHIVGLFEYANRVADGLGLETHGQDSPMLLEALHQKA